VSAAGRTSERLPFDWQEAKRALAASDAVLGRHMRRVGPRVLALKPVTTTYATLAEAIVYQQLSGKAAATIFGRVLAASGGPPLDPERVGATRDRALRAAGLSRAKLAALRDLTERALDGSLPAARVLRRMSDEAIVERLTEVRGVGRWTVEMLLLFGLGRPDVLPVADYGVRKGFGRLYGHAEPPPGRVLAEHAERFWRPWRSVASWYMWRALER
jgi:DNA-3-methyladenine glycosylase II